MNEQNNELEMIPESEENKENTGKEPVKKNFPKTGRYFRNVLWFVSNRSENG